MLKAVILAAALLPLAAQADPSQTYAVGEPKAEASSPHGWGLFVSAKGRSLDLRSPDSGWSEDPQLMPGDFQAGFGWRKNAASALVGYQQADYGPKRDDAVPAFGPHRGGGGGGGVIGLGLALHTH